MNDPNKTRDESSAKMDAIEIEQHNEDNLDVYPNPDDDQGKDPFGNPSVNTWSDDDGETWYEGENGDRYTEDMGPPGNWPDHD